MNEEITIIELFGGIGALTKAFKRLGIPHKIVDYVEIDKYAVKSYNAINGTNFEPQDICKWDKDIKVDLIMHGSPCQDFSLAGKQAGGDEGSGTRSSLMYETIRIVEKLKPKYVIWENVKNLLSKKHRHNFNAYLETMEQLGYTNYYQVLNAKDYGIPQNRERVFTVSILKEIVVYDDYNSNIREDQDTIGTLTTNCGSSAIRNGWKIIEHTPSFVFPQPQELKLKLKDMLEENVEEKYYLSDKMVNFFYKNEQVQKEKGNGFRFNVTDGDVIAKTITTRAGSRMDDNFLKLPNKALRETLENNEIGDEEVQYIDSYNRKIKKDGLAKTITTRVNDSNNDYLLIKNNTKKGYLEAYEGDGVDISSRMQYHRGTVQKESIQTITTSGGNDRGVIVGSTQKHAAISTNGIVPTLTSAMGQGGGHVPMHNYDLRIRKLTPKECWRLMGFDDEDCDKAAKVNSNTQLYKQAGNSIVVNVLEAILTNLLLNTEQEKQGQMDIFDFIAS